MIFAHMPPYIEVKTMGTDIHAVLQKKVKGEYKTVIFDVIPGRDYFFFEFLSGIRGSFVEHRDVANKGLPEDFKLTSTDDAGRSYEGPPEYHEGFYMGSHTYGHLTLQELCDAPTGNTDEYEYAQFLQKSMKLLFADLSEYRLVFGYDS